MNIIWIFLEFCINLFEGFITIKYCNVMLSKKYNKFNDIIGISSIGIIISSFNIYSHYYGHKGSLGTLFMFLLMYAVVHYIYIDNILKKLISVIIVIITFAVTDSIVLVLFGYIIKEPASILLVTPIYRIIGIVLSKMLLFFVVVFLINRRKNNWSFTIRKNYIIDVIGLFLINFFIIINTVPYYNRMSHSIEFSELTFITIIIGMCLINFISIFIFEKILSESDNEMKLKLQIQQYEMQYKYIDEINQATKVLSGLRHDMANHLGNIKGLLDYDEIDKLKEYVYSISEEMKTADEIVVTNRPAISALLNRKYRICKEENIKLNLHTSMNSVIDIDDVDICIILGNLLDNAIEACKKVSKDKYINANIEVKGNYLLIDIINKTDGVVIQKDGELLTTKKDKKLHGIGFKNIRSIVEKYNGDIQIDIKKDEVKIYISLLL